MNSTEETSSKSSKSQHLALKIVLIFLAVLLILTGVFFLYDSPANYIVTQNDEIYLNSDGKPILYYTDLFGNTFYQDNGKREYAAVPTYIESNVKPN